MEKAVSKVQLIIFCDVILKLSLFLGCVEKKNSTIHLENTWEYIFEKPIKESTSDSDIVDIDKKYGVLNVFASRIR